MLNRVRNIGLSWKVQIAPAFLIVVLVGLGAYALQTLRFNQASVDALMVGPVVSAMLSSSSSTLSHSVPPSVQVVWKHATCHPKYGVPDAGQVKAGAP